ncbi:unnamed protein product [marine sediment metagenome]|uniref:Uncharacterized protein n=1 Tax=marine sediment metagenome TaxID=412755 RepID=X0Z545_9ZZZZ
MEELIKEVEQILNQFFIECRGNRLNQFAWVTLVKTILDTIRNHKPIKSEVIKDVKK